MKNIVRLTKKQSNDISVMTKVIGDLGSIMGHPTCCSGHPLEFEIVKDEVKSASGERENKRYFINEQGNLIEE